MLACNTTNKSVISKHYFVISDLGIRGLKLFRLKNKGCPPADTGKGHPLWLYYNHYSL